jgi:hypothetical protein
VEIRACVAKLEIDTTMRRTGCRRRRQNHHVQLLPLLLSLIAFFEAVVPSAQDMEPRAYSRAPVGTQFVVVTYAFQTGDVLTDPTLPLLDVSVTLNSVAFGYGRTFNLAGRQANASALIPYISGRVKGKIFEDRQEITRSGLGDVRMRFSAYVIGGPALDPQQFAAYKRKTLLGLSLTVVAPTGQYDPRRLVNLGSNRWSFKPEVGLSTPSGRWTIEIASGVWLFTPNNNFFGGSRREQKPLASLQAHVIYTLRRRMWVALDATYYNGGRTVVDNILKADLQSNSRVGTTFSFPLSQRQSIKLIWARGLTSRFGGNLSTVTVGWNYTWIK